LKVFQSPSTKKKYNIFIYHAPNLIKMPGIQFCVYIMTDEQHRLLYTGRTADLKRRVAQHRSGNGGVFTRRNNLVKLVYYEQVTDALAAKLREKQIKRSSKKQRLVLIERMNPTWMDLYEKIQVANCYPRESDR